MELNEKQIQILEIAEKLFAEHGFDATSVRQIAKEADINIAMISYYFGSKEKMLDTLLAYKTSDFRTEIKGVLENGQATYLEKTDAIVAFLVKRIHRNRRIYKIMHFENANGCRNIDIDKYMQEKLQNYRIIEQFIQKGQEEGVFSKNLEIPLIVPTVMGTYLNFYYNKKLFRLIYDLNEESIDDYVFTTLTQHIQKTIKALLTYEN